MASIISAGTTSGTALNFTGDTSGNLELKTGAGANTISIPNVTGTATVMPTGYTLGAGNTTRFKNRIINGDMRIDQRNAGASITPTVDGTFSLDRWRVSFTQASKFSIQQNAGSITPPTGFTNYLGITSTSAYSVGAGDVFGFIQPIEGNNVADLSFGTSNAKTVTLSFWVYSSLTGTFSGSLINSALNRTYPYTYSIPTANTWTQISITIAGDQTGTWLTTNGIGLGVYFCLGTGSTYGGTAGSWVGSAKLGVASAVSVVGTSGATFYITGVQIEVGSTASAFEYVDYGTQLYMCLRYFFKETGNLYIQNNNVTGSFTSTVNLPCYMRTSPTVTFTNNGGATPSAGDLSPTKYQLTYSSNSFTACTYTASSEL